MVTFLSGRHFESGNPMFFKYGCETHSRVGHESSPSNYYNALHFGTCSRALVQEKIDSIYFGMFDFSILEPFLCELQFSKDCLLGRTIVFNLANHINWRRNEPTRT